MTGLPLSEGRGVRDSPLARVYGPTLLPDDSKALSQFMHHSLTGEDVVLKSEGTQRFSYLHVADAVSGLLYVLLFGADGEAYNLADEGSDIALKDLAAIVAEVGRVKVVFDLPTPRRRPGIPRRRWRSWTDRRQRASAGLLLTELLTEYVRLWSK